MSYGIDTAAADPCRATLVSSGAVGDGTHDDTTALQSAIKTGCSLDGESKRYRITRSLRIQTGTDIANATLIQAIPAGELLRPIYGHHLSDVRLTNIRIDRGTDPFLGTIADAAGIWLASIKGVTLTDVEVFGGGPGTGILVVHSSNVKLVRPYVHDIRWAMRDGQPCNEVVQGIQVSNSDDAEIIEARVADLSPSFVVVNEAGVRGCREIGQTRAAGQINNMSDGIAPTGNRNMRILSPKIWNVGEGIDVSGNPAEHLLIANADVHDVSSACYKFSHKQGPDIVVRESRAVRCGLWGFVIGGPISGLSLINNQAVDIGSDGPWQTGRFGFYLSYSKATSESDPPKGITLIGNKVERSRNTDIDYYFRLGPGGIDQNIVFRDNSTSGSKEGVRCHVGRLPRDVGAPSWCKSVER